MRKGHQTGTASSSAYQPTLSESVEKSQEYDKKGKQWIKLTEAVTYYIAKDGRQCIQWKDQVSKNC